MELTNGYRLNPSDSPDWYRTDKNNNVVIKIAFFPKALSVANGNGRVTIIRPDNKTYIKKLKDMHLLDMMKIADDFYHKNVKDA